MSRKNKNFIKVEEELEEKIKKISIEIRLSNAIAVIGAGASFDDGMPLAGQLAPLLWQTIDENEEAKSRLINQLGIANNYGKHIIGDDWDRVVQAFKIISEIPDARESFQNTFASLNKERVEKASKTYKSLARLIHDGFIELIVSLNWDTLLEYSWKSLYGVDINANEELLIKPHGSANNPKENWVLPHEAGFISQELQEKIKLYVKDRPRLLLVIGYSEQDEKVLKELIHPLENRWRIIRINPAFNQEYDIPLAASKAIPKIADILLQGHKESSWHYETFANQRGIEAAIGGERLGSRDVKSCPKLPQVERSLHEIDIYDKVQITGSPGCGKSITSYQIAYELMKKDGFEVLHVINNKISENELIDEIRNISRKSILLVDDAQQFTPQFRQEIQDLTSDNLKAIITLTDTSDKYPQSIRIVRDEAVDILAQYYSSRVDKILPIVQKFDNHVGKRYLDIPISRRIKSAKEKAQTPWQFNFILRGGWRNAQNDIGAVKDINRSDVLLTIIAIEQIISLDSSVPIKRLKELIIEIGFNEEWLSESIKILDNRRLIIQDSGIRCPHIRFATVVLKNFYKTHKDDFFNEVNSIISNHINDGQTSLQGISWLLNELRFTNAFRFRRKDKIITDDIWENVIERCFNQVNHVERNYAAFVINRLCKWIPNGYHKIGTYFETIVSWIEQIDQEYALGISRFLNGLINNNKELLKRIVLEVDPALVAENVSSITSKGGYSIGEILSRLRFGISEDWVFNFNKFLEVDRIRSMIRLSRPKDLFHIAKFIEGISYYNEELAYDCLDDSLSIIKKGLKENPLSNWENIRDLLSRLLGLPSHFEKPGLEKKQATYSKKIASFLPPSKIASGISIGSQRDWERYSRLIGWLFQIKPEMVKDIVDKVDMDKMDSNTEGLWNCPPRELRLLIFTLGQGLGEKNELSDWIKSHVEEIETIDPLIGWVCPEVAIQVVKGGGELDLFGHNGSNWELCNAVIQKIHKIDEKTVREVLESNSKQISKSISELKKIDCTEGLITFLDILDKNYPKEKTHIFNKIDVETARNSWQDRLKEKEINRKVVLKLISIAENVNDGALNSLSNDLKKHSNFN